MAPRLRQIIDVFTPQSGSSHGKRRTERAADENVVIQIPDGCLTRGAIVKHIIGLAITVKVGCGYQ